jgi:predicted NBD/HSP70 family sugar kinase
MTDPSDIGQNRESADPAPVRGSNQSDMRAHNERLFLTLVRRNGALAKSDVARLTGLSAQTVSVIMRALENDGLLLRGEPQRGRIGQPSVPLSLNPEGAFFLGLKIGRRSADLTLIDFLGGVRASKRQIYPYPTPDLVEDFVRRSVPNLVGLLPKALRARVKGLGVAMPYKMWDWGEIVGALQGSMTVWRDFDLQGALEALTGLPVFVQNDASSACGAELLFGKGERPRDFLYFYFGTFIGGGLVMGGQLYLGPTGNAAGVGSMPIPGGTGSVRSLIDAASMQALANQAAAAGESSDHLWEQPDEWRVSAPVLSAWLDEAAAGLAWATLSAAALLDLDTAVIDGWMPPSIRAEIVKRTREALNRFDLSGVTPPSIREGTVGAYARSLGAAAIPLSNRYLIT